MLTVEGINQEIADVIRRGDTRQDVAHLANLFVVRDGLSGIPATKASPEPVLSVPASGESDFLRAVAGKDSGRVWAVMDEAMDTLKSVFPRLYAGIMQQISEI